MKISVQMSLSAENEIILDINYQGKFLSLIKRGLSQTNPDLFNELYNKNSAKSFTTSMYFPEATFTKDKIILAKEVKNNAIMNFSCEDSVLGLSFYNAFMHLHNQGRIKLNSQLSVYVSNLVLHKEFSIVSEEIIVKTLSPIAVRNQQSKFLSLSKENINEFNSALRENTKAKIKIIHPELLSLVDDLEMIPITTKKVIVKHFDINVEATIGKFILKGNSLLLNVLYRTGLGVKTGGFLGMISLIKEV